MSHFKPPPEFLVTEQPASAWAEWKQRFCIYAEATELSAKTVSSQLNIFLHVLGLAGLKIFNNFKLPPTTTLAEALLAFDSYFKPYLNITHLSYVFFSSKQRSDQTIDHFILELSEKASRCDFGSLSDRLVRDILICGIFDNDLRQRLLALPDPPLSEVSTYCRAFEQSKRHMAVMTPYCPSSKLPAVDSLSLASANPPNTGNRSIRRAAPAPSSSPAKCSRCAYNHRHRQCPARGKSCNTCGGRDHFATCCPTTNAVSTVEVSEQFPVRTPSPVALINSISASSTSLWVSKLSVCGKSVDFKLDSGSDLNVISESLFNSFPFRPPLLPHRVVAKTYSGHVIPFIGKFVSTLSHSGISVQASFVVTSIEAQPVLSGATCLALNLLARVNTVVSVETAPDVIISTFSDVFSPTLGKINRTYSLALREDAIPVVSPTRRLPHALLEPIEAVLHDMVKQGVIARVTEPTDWVNAVLPVSKDGKIRIALDPRPLNRYIKRQHHPIPSMDSILAKISDCKVFTVLDGRDAFWQMQLDHRSSLLCTFATPFGRFRFLRVPYGISSAPEFQQSTMDEMCDGLDGTAAFFDDIIIGGRDLPEHNVRLASLLSRARKFGLHLKSEKTQLAQPSVNFVGHVISADGVSPSPKNIDAIAALPSPSSKKELQRFLGMIGYLSKYIPNFTECTAYLRSLLVTNVDWIWSSMAESDFLHLKSLVNSPPLLAHFDPKCPLRLSVDASQHGLGAVLMQGGHPIQYASVKLSPAQVRYAQIEKELLAIVFGCTRFHFFTYGRPVEVETDHRPLLAIVTKPFSAVSPRLQRLLLKLQAYSISLVYTPGKRMFVADTLSRSPSSSLMDRRSENADYQVLSLSIGVNFHSEMHRDLVACTSSDSASQALVKYFAYGWPPAIGNVSPALKQFWTYRHELYRLDGLIYKGTRVFVPEAFRPRVLAKIHESHQGIVACKARAREHVFWPGMSTEIESYVSSCQTCQSLAVANPKEPLLSHDVPPLPWHKLGLDLFKVQGSNYLLVVDFFSKFVEMVPLGPTTIASVIIDAMKSIFSTHGLPVIIVSDNGPPFNSAAFSSFAKLWDFKHSTSSPTYSQSNGQVERMVRTIKSQLIKCISSGSDPYRVILNYVSTPHDSLPSPASLLMSRRLRTSLPVHPVSFRPSVTSTSVTMNTHTARQLRQKFYYDRSSRPLPPFQPGDLVSLRRLDGVWIPGAVIHLADQPRSYWVEIANGTVLRRNRVHLRPRKVQQPMLPENASSLQQFDAPNVLGSLPSSLTPHPDPTDSLTQLDLPLPQSQPVSPPSPVSAVDPPNKLSRSGRVIRLPIRFQD